MLVRVIRPLCINAVRQEPGTVVDLPDHVAREAIWCGKAEKATVEPPISGPMTMAGLTPQTVTAPAVTVRAVKKRRF